VVWFDALVTNVDRTAKNPSRLVWHRALWCIDHGASLYVHHDWVDAPARAANPFPQIREHVLLPLASDVGVAGASLRPRLSVELLSRVAESVPEAWLPPDPRVGDAAAQRRVYVEWLSLRLERAPLFEEEANRARALRV
jgi:hypothetical protein